MDIYEQAICAVIRSLIYGPAAPDVPTGMLVYFVAVASPLPLEEELVMSWIKCVLWIFVREMS